MDPSSGNKGVAGGSPKLPEELETLERRWVQTLDRLERIDRLSRTDVRRAFEDHPRWRFLPSDSGKAARSASVEDKPVSLPGDQTISAPHMVSILLETADPGPGDRCLEIGAGSGWLAAILAQVVGEDGHVVTMELLPELAELARGNLERAGIRNAEVVVGDGSLGHPEGAPYDRIIVSCGAPSVPEPLREQLAVGGRLVIPVGGRRHQKLVTVERTEAGFAQDDLGGCAFVPLVGRHGFDPSER